MRGDEPYCIREENQWSKVSPICVGMNLPADLIFKIRYVKISSTGQ